MLPAWLSRLLIAMAAAAMLSPLLALPAGAQTDVAGRDLKTCILPDHGENPAALIRQPGSFDCTTPQYKSGSGNFWVVSEDINQRSSSRQPLNIRSTSLWQGGVTLYFLYSDGRMTSIATGKAGITPFLQLGAVAEYPVPREAANLVRVMWHVTGAANVRGVVLGARITTAEDSARANMKLAAMYAAFVGLCLGLVCYNLALWGALRHRFQLWYCAMTGGLMVYAFSSSGAMAWVWPDLANNDRLRVSYLVLGCVAASALMFARTFFEERVFAGWLGKLASGVAAMMAAAGAMVFFTAPFAVRTADLIFTCIFVGMAAIVVPTLWRAYKLRSNYLWLFALAWGSPILMGCLRSLGNFHILAWNFWLDNSTILSMGMEALLSSVAIAYRINLLSKERDAAMAGEEYARRLAETDPLTGLLNRRAFLEKAIGREGEQVLQIADLDHFKSVNDTLGHDGGDEVLRVFARMLRAAVPAGALVARIGGEEFAILCSSEDAIEGERILAKLRAARMPFDVRVTASIGTCTGLLANEPQWKSLYRGADKALFEAKSAGRDRARAAPVREAA